MLTTQDVSPDSVRVFWVRCYRCRTAASAHAVVPSHTGHTVSHHSHAALCTATVDASRTYLGASQTLRGPIATCCQHFASMVHTMAKTRSVVETEATHSLRGQTQSDVSLLSCLFAPATPSQTCFATRPQPIIALRVVLKPSGARRTLNHSVAHPEPNLRPVPPRITSLYLVVATL
jgi:hypothetical protein